MGAPDTSPAASETPEASPPDDRADALYRGHAAAVGRYVRRRIGPDSDAAADVVSETFVVACRRIDDVPEEALPWLYGVARRVLANHHRGADRRGRLTERAAAEPDGNERSAEPDDDALLTRAVLGRLAEPDREILLLHAWEGLDHTAAGVVLGCSARAVAVRLHRAKRRFVRLYQEEMNGDSP